MQHILNGRDSLSLLMALNWDRIMSVGTLALALLAGGYIGSLL